jgi:hypothetical protein
MTIGKSYNFNGSMFSVQVGLGSPKTITNITAANPPVVSAAAHGFVLGDAVKLQGIDAPSQLDDGVFAVDNPASGTFELFGVNGLLYDAFDAGSPNATASPITFSDFCELTGLNQQDGGADQHDVTTICDTAKRFKQGLSDSGTLQLDFNWAGLETVQAALRAAKISGAILAFKIVMPEEGGIVLMTGTVQQTSFQGSVSSGVYTASATIKLSGEVAVLESA